MTTQSKDSLSREIVELKEQVEKLKGLIQILEFSGSMLTRLIADEHGIKTEDDNERNDKVLEIVKDHFPETRIVRPN